MSANQSQYASTSPEAVENADHFDICPERPNVFCDKYDVGDALHSLVCSLVRRSPLTLACWKARRSPFLHQHFLQPHRTVLMARYGRRKDEAARPGVCEPITFCTHRLQLTRPTSSDSARAHSRCLRVHGAVMIAHSATQSLWFDDLLHDCHP